MARKKQERRVPQVPRSMAGKGSAPATESAATETPARRAVVVETPVTSAPSLAEEYAHVKNDLTRIALFGSLIFAGMLILKFAVGL